jgi:hypothetical protein
VSRRAVIEETLRDIYDQRGELVPEYIVNVASSEEHPLHTCFTWDDTEAARRYRLTQAGNLIRSVKIVVITDDETYKVRAYHSLRNLSQDRPGYVPDSEVRESPEQRSLLLQAMKRDWNAAKRRYDHVSEFWEMVRAEEPKTEEPVAV